MFADELEDRFRQLIGANSADAPRRESIRFAVRFARLLGRILLEQDLTPHARTAMRNALEARTILVRDEIDTLIELALTPQSRIRIDERDLRAFASRFGDAESDALRARLGDEVELADFAETYGEDESLLLLDSLFRVCAVDGRIDRGEIGRLVQAAEELGIDSALIGALFRKHDPRHAAGELHIVLERERYGIGRAIHNDLPLPDPQIAPRHAELFRTTEGWRVFDLESGRPTLIDGQPITDHALEPGQELRIGSYALTLDEDRRRLRIRAAAGFSTLSVRDLHRTLPNGRALLSGVDFTVFTGEVVAVVGPSGSGKTTLLDAIAGIHPPTRGGVIYDGRSFASVLGEDPAVVGMVPQDDVVHPDLTVEEALWYAGRLRLPASATGADVQAEVERVVQELALADCRSTRVGDPETRGISGGQRKRVNVGQELLTSSTRVLFLDEPTSGLDPQTSQDLVRMVRQLADDGRIAFVVTHDLSPSILSMVDHLLVMAPGGHLAWYGPPAEAAQWFKVSSPDEIFGVLPNEAPETWAARFAESAAYRKYVRVREHLLGLDEVEIEPVRPRTPAGRQSRRTQLGTLTARYLRTKVRDIGGLAVLLAQAPVLGLLMWAVFPAPDPSAMFVLVLSCLWFGASASVRELISDRLIWKREARIGVSAAAYVTSKVLVMGTLTALQCATLATICFYALPLNGTYGYSLPGLIGVCALTGWSGMGIGLFIGARSTSSQAAVGSLPLVLIPQILFGGLIVRVDEMTEPLAEVLSSLMIVRYAFEAAIKTGRQLTEAGDTARGAKPLGGILYNLGMRASSSLDDMGIPLPALLGIMIGFVALMLLLTWFQTWRTGRR